MLLGALGFAVVLVAGYSGRALTEAAAEQKSANQMLIRVTDLRDRAREGQVMQWEGVAGQPDVSPLRVAAHLAVVMADARNLARDEAAHRTEAAAPAGRVVVGLSKLEKRLGAYVAATSAVQRQAVVAGSVGELEVVAGDMAAWVDACAHAAQVATVNFHSTARRMSLLLILVVAAVMLVGVAVWLTLERLRSGLFQHVDSVRHEQAGLRRVAELVAAEESEHTVLSAVAQEMTTLTGAGGGWVVRIEGSRAFIHGAQLYALALRAPFGTSPSRCV